MAEGSLADVARDSAQVLLDTPHWLHRRVQRFSVLPNGLTETQLSVDFTIPEELPTFEDLSSRKDESYGVFWVPLLMLRKWPPVPGFDFVDPDGKSLPLLTSEKNREVDSELLLGLAPDGPLRELLEDHMRMIVTADKQFAIQHFEELGSAFRKNLTSVPAADRHRWRQTLRLAGRLASNSIVWARVTGRRGDRMIVKLRFQDENRRELVLWRRIAASLGWAPVRLAITIPNVDWGRSFHLQIDPPLGLRVHEARLLLQPSPSAPPSSRTTRAIELWWALRNTLRWKFQRGIGIERSRVQGVTGSAPLQPEENKPPAGSAYTRDAPERAYLYVTGERSEHAVAEVGFAAADGHPLRRGGVLVSATLTALLTGVLAMSGRALHHVEATVVLLAVPAALLGGITLIRTSYAAHGHHLAGARALLFAVVMLPFAAALGVIGSTRASELRVWLWLGVAVGVLITLALSLTWLLPPVKRPFPPRRSR